MTPLHLDPRRQAGHDRALAALADIDRLRCFQLSANHPRVIAAYAALGAALDDLYGPLPEKTIEERTRH